MEIRAFRIWFAAGVRGIIAQIYSLCQLNLPHQGPEKQLIFKKHASKLQLVAGVCDVTMSSAAAGLIKLDEGVVCACGVLSSLIAIHNHVVLGRLN